MQSNFYLFTLLLLLSISNCYAQNIDSLQNVLLTTKQNDTKVRTLFEISDYWSYRDTTKGFYYLEEANKLIKDSYLRGIYNFYKGQNLFDYDPKKAQECYLQADELLQNYDKKEAYFFRTRAWHNFGAIEQILGREPIFLKILIDRCIPLSKKSGDIILLANQYADIGIVLKNQKQYEKSIQYYRDAIKLLNKEPYSYRKGNKLIEIFGIINEMFLYQSDTVNAKNTLDTLSLLYKQYPETNSGVYYYYANGKYHQFLKDYSKALQYINQGLKHIQKFTNTTDFSRLLNEKAFCLSKLERYSEAKKAYLESYHFAIQNDAISNAIIHLKMLAEIEEVTGSGDSAYKYLKEAYTLSDSLNNQQIKETIAELETKFDTAEKEKAITELENKTRIQKITLWSTLIILAIIIFFFFYAMAQRKKRLQQQLQMIEQEKEIQISKALMEGEEQERLRLAKDLHDGLGGTLTAIKIKLEDYAIKNDNSLLNKTVGQLNEAVNELRNTARNLLPENLMKYGLEEALRDFCISADTEKTKIQFYAGNLSAITDKNKQLVIYRIVQELLNNALKHAFATKILLQITLENNLLLIDIEDNGIGFDPKTVKRNMGLNNIEMRVKYLEGKMSIDAKPGKGTNINIECII